MTVGDYPDKVPSDWLIPPSKFKSSYPLPRFPDIAGKLGLDLNDLAGSVVMEDFDNDGDLDLMICAWGARDPLRYFVNRGDGTFQERTREAGLPGEVGGLNMVQADYNNDGFMDVLILRGAWLQKQGRQPCSLLRNNGDGTFEDVTEEVGLLRFHPTQTATWLDYNNDGWIDLYIGNESTPGETNRCELFRNRGDGTFVECAADVGVDALGLVKAVHSGDFNNDGWPDLYVSCRRELNFLFRNDGPQSTNRSPSGAWKFTNIAAAAGVAEPKFSFPAFFFDYDNDGWLDLFVCGYRIKDVGDVAADVMGAPSTGERSRLYHNRGDGTFQDVSAEAGLNQVIEGMSSNFGDLDNDGWLDFYVGTGDPELATLVPNRMFRNDGAGHFQDVTTAGGFGHLQKGHGIAFGDLNGDGDQDIYASLGGAYEGDYYRNALFENPGNTNDWIKLKLVGTRSNRAGIGARITVRLRNAAGFRVIRKDVNSGSTFGGNSLRQEIGLGAAATIEEIEVWWPTSGSRQTWKGLEPQQSYILTEGKPDAVLQSAPRLQNAER